MIYPELLQDANDAVVQRLLHDPDWVWQEKENGDRRLVSKETMPDGEVRIADWNRSASRGKGLSPEIVAALKSHPLHQFVIDCEFVSGVNRLYVFDALYLGGLNVVCEKYRTRLEHMHSAFDGFHDRIVPVESAFTPEEKIAMFERVRGIFGEGIVMKDLDAPYRPSDNNQRFNWRYKFVKTLDAVVIGDSTKRDDKGMLKNSVRLGLYMPDGTLKDICGATKKSSFMLRPGDVVQVVYLYGTGWTVAERDVVQPRLDTAVKQPRDDKRAQDCTIDQIVVNKNWRKVA